MNSEFSLYFRSLRTRYDLSQAQLAEKASLSVRTLAYWESGAFEPRIAELKSALQALGASEEEQLRAFSLLKAPRGTRQAQEEIDTRANVPQGIGLQSHIGDLLHTLRLRRRMTAVQLAKSLGVHVTTVHRWEKLALIPSEESLDRLCAALGARPEERLALVARRLHPPEEEEVSVEALERRAEAFMREIHQPGEPLIDLHALTLRRQIWPLLPRLPEAQRWLAMIDTHYSYWLTHRSRYAEGRRFIASAMNLLASGLKPESFWTDALCIAAIHAETGPRPAPENAVQLIRRWAASFTAPEMAVHFYAYIAEYTSRTGQHLAAMEMLDQAEAAERVAEDRCWNPYLCGVSRGRALTRAGRPSEALDLMPQPRTDGHLVQAHQTCLWVETLLAAGEKAEAHTYLQRLYAVLDLYPSPKFQERADRLARRLG